MEQKLPVLIFQGRNGRTDQSANQDPLADVSGKKLNNHRNRRLNLTMIFHIQIQTVFLDYSPSFLQL